MKIFNKGFNFNQDGPGNRLVYHLSGCNMHCIWCSNPEGIDGKVGKDYNEQQIIDECVSCKPMFFSGGGVTFTGGEATLQYRELKTVLMDLKNKGIHTCIETNAQSDKLIDLSPFIDYLIMDFKHYDGQKLKEFTGLDTSKVKEKFSYLSSTRSQLHVRIPLINGFNAENPSGFTEFFTLHDTKNVVFEFLPYHEYGKDKWKTEYKVKNGFIDKEIIKNFKEEFAKRGLKVVKT